MATGTFHIPATEQPVEFDFDDMMADVKDGVYGGIALGGGVSVTAQIPGAIYAGAMAVTSLPSVRDAIQIEKLTNEYDTAPDQARSSRR